MISKKILKRIVSITITTTMGLSFMVSANAKPLNDYFEKLNLEVVKSSEDVNWQQFTPGNCGYSESVFVHPTDPNTIFNFPDMFNSYRSVDGGKTWNTIIDSDISIQQIARVYGVDFSRQNEKLGMAVNGSGAYITKDKGASWNKINYDFGASSSITVDPNDDKRWYIGSGQFWNIKKNSVTNKAIHGEFSKTNLGKLWISTDAGENWSLINTNGIPSKVQFSKIIIKPDDSKTMFASTNYGAYKSIDGGINWSKFDNLDEASNDIEQTSGDDYDLVRDMTSYYNKETGEFNLYLINQIRYVKNPKTKSIDSYGGILKSKDLGKTWENLSGDIGLNMREINEQYPAPEGDDSFDYPINYYYCDARAIPRYFGEKGVDLRKEYPVLSERFLQAYSRIVVDPTNPDKIYVSHNASHGISMCIGDVWKTDDSGNHWEVATRIGTGWGDKKEYWESKGQDTDVNVEFNQAGEMYYDSVFHTKGARDLDITSNGDVLVMFRNLVKSTDDGDTWKQLDAYKTSNGNWVGTGASNLPGIKIEADPSNPDILYFLTSENSMFKLANDGSEYIDRIGLPSVTYFENCPECPSALAIDPKNPNNLYVIICRMNGQGDLFESTDGGKTWTDVTNVFKPAASDLYKKTVPHSLIIDPNNSDIMYLSITNVGVTETSSDSIPKFGDYFGVYKSTDRGRTWKHIKEDFPREVVSGKNKGAFPYTMIFDPNNSDILYAGITAGDVVSMGNMNFSNKFKDWVIEGNVINDLGRAKISGISKVERTIGNLTPDTNYYLSSKSNVVSDGQRGYLQVYDSDGKLISEKVFNNTDEDINGISFKTGKEETSVKIVLCGKDENSIIYGTNFVLRLKGGLYKSNNKAENWSRVETLPEDISQVNQVAIDTNKNKIYIATGDKNTGLESGGLWVADYTGENAFKNWTKIFEMPFIVGVKIDSNNSNRIMVTVKNNNSKITNYNSGIYLSENLGLTWTKINEGIGNSNTISDMCFDNSDRNILWAVTTAGGFYKGTIDRTGVDFTDPDIAVIDEVMNLVVDGSINVINGATQDDKTEAVQKYVDNLIINDVKAVVTFKDEHYVVTFTKGEVTKTKILNMIIKEEVKDEDKDNDDNNGQIIDDNKPLYDSDTSTDNNSGKTNLPTTGSNISIFSIIFIMLSAGIVLKYIYSIRRKIK